MIRPLRWPRRRIASVIVGVALLAPATAHSQRANPTGVVLRSATYDAHAGTHAVAFNRLPVGATAKRGAIAGAVSMGVITALFVGVASDENVGYMVGATLGGAIAGAAMGAFIGAVIGLVL